MATLNVSNLLVQLNQKINSTSDDKEILILTKAIEKLKTGIVFTVPTFANLPDASENTGKLYFVENDGILYFSVVSTYYSTEYWAPITIEISPSILFQASNLPSATCLTVVPCTISSGAGFSWCTTAVIGPTTGRLAIKRDGTLWGWGCNNCGILGDGTTVNRTSPGTVAGAGTNWCWVSGGTFNVAAIKTDGTLWTWGRNSAGNLGDGTTLARCSPGTIAGGGTNWSRVSVGSYTLAIKTDGTLWTWGSNFCGGLGNGTTLNRCSPGTVAGAGTNWCQVSSGFWNSSAVKSDGTLWTWGRNNIVFWCGVLGDGTITNRSSPGTVSGGGTNWCQVSNGSYHSAAIKCDGTLWTWGGCLRLGDGTTTQRSSPGTISGGGTTWCQVSAGGYTTALKTDGTMWSFTSGAPSQNCGGGTSWCFVTSSLPTNFCSSSREITAIQRETL